MKLFDKIFGSSEAVQHSVAPISAEQRHKYEYEVLPSAADCAPEFLFEQDSLVKVVYDKTDLTARRFISDIVLKRYDAGKVHVSVLEFPKPQANGELQFAASIIHEDILQDYPVEPRALCPYYFLAHMPEGYVAGEVLTDMDEYPVVYHDTFPDAGLDEFLGWVLQKSGLDVNVKDLRLL